MKAIFFVGGWEGHNPTDFADWCANLLYSENFQVDIYDSLEPLEHPEKLADADVIIPIWSSARSSHKPEFANMTKKQEDGLLKLIADGCGLAGWHGHMGDAFRDRPTYHFLIGGQFVAHPPGWPDNPIPSDDFVKYEVNICRPNDPIVKGIKSFELITEHETLKVRKFGNHLSFLTVRTLSRSKESLHNVILEYST